MVVDEDKTGKTAAAAATMTAAVKSEVNGYRTLRVSQAQVLTIAVSVVSRFGGLESDSVGVVRKSLRCRNLG